MRLIRLIRHRLRTLLHRGSVEAELDRELAFHLEQLTKDNIEAGMSPPEARQAAQRAFGNVALLEEECRDQRRLAWFEDLRQDVAYAIRRARHDPGLVILITLVLGVGIGVNTTVFSLLKNIVLPNLPVHEQDRLALVWSVNQERNVDRSPLSRGDFADLKRRSTSFSSLAASERTSVHFEAGSEPLRLVGDRVTTNLFAVLGVTPAAGRDFQPEDALSTTSAVILSGQAWRQYFGGDPSVLGRSITIDGKPYRVIGVTGPDFWFMARDVAFWLPMREPDPSDDREDRNLIVVGRMNPGVQRSQVESATLVVSHQIEKQSGLAGRGWEMTVTGLLPLRPAEKAAIFMMFWIVALILAMACANIANILLARSLGRKREIGVRLALGAGRQRLIRQLVVESMVYASLGTAVGLVLGAAATDLVRRSMSSPFLSTAHVDFPVLVAGLLIGAVCALLVGLTPALYSLRPGIVEALKQGAGVAFTDARGARLRRFLLTGQVACATMLVLVTGLMIRSASQLHSQKLGFRMDGILTFRLDLPEYRYPEMASVARAQQRLLSVLRSAAGFLTVGAGNRVPIEGSRNNPTLRFRTDRDVPANRDSGRWALDLAITPGYLEALGVPLLRGRYFADLDNASSVPVAVISHAMATRYFGGEDPIGRKIELDSRGGESLWTTIIGVVGDVRNDNAFEPPAPTVYLPLSQRPSRTATYVVRCQQNLSSAAETVRKLVRNVEPGLPVYRQRPMREVIREDFSDLDSIVGLLSVFGAVAVFVASLGIFGVLSHLIAARRAEIGIRIALGAVPAEVARLFLRQGLCFASSGLILGTLGGIAAGWAFRAALAQVRPFDPVTVFSTLLLLLAAAASASYLPARRATGVDPLSILRSE